MIHEVEGQEHGEPSREAKTTTPLSGQHVALGTAIQTEALNHPEDTRYKPHSGHDRRAAQTESSQGSNSGTPEVCGSEDARRPYLVRRHP